MREDDNKLHNRLFFIDNPIDLLPRPEWNDLLFTLGPTLFDQFATFDPFQNDLSGIIPMQLAFVKRTAKSTHEPFQPIKGAKGLQKMSNEREKDRGCINSGRA